MKKAKAKIKKVIKGLKGAVKAHTGQHKMLSSVLKSNGKRKKSQERNGETSRKKIW